MPAGWPDTVQCSASKSGSRAVMSSASAAPSSTVTVVRLPASASPSMLALLAASAISSGAWLLARTTMRMSATVVLGTGGWSGSGTKPASAGGRPRSVTSRLRSCTPAWAAVGVQRSVAWPYCAAGMMLAPAGRPLIR